MRLKFLLLYAILRGTIQFVNNNNVSLLSIVLGLIALPHVALAAVGCATPTNTTVYYQQAFQTCAGTSVDISNTTLFRNWNSNTLSSHACNSLTGGALRYRDGSLELCDGTSWATLGAGSSTSSDRITSGTTSVIANTATSSISFTTNGSQRMTIGSSGNVGIGTTTPGSPIAISSTITTSNNGITLTNSSSISTYKIWVGTSGNGDGYLKFGIDPANQNSQAFLVSSGGPSVPTGKALGLEGNSFIGSSSYGSNYSLKLGYNATPYTELSTGSFIALSVLGSTKLYVSNSGNVGIGTTTPSGTLSVSGTVAMSLYSAAPVTCGVTYKGLMALTSAAHMCVCDSTSWVDVDGRAACSW